MLDFRENGSNSPMGKYMLAIIGQQAKGAFEIILYRETTKILVREILGNSMVLYKYPNNFVAFYDRTQQLWNLNFDKQENLDEFLQHATKCNSRVVDKAEGSDLGKHSPSVEAETTDSSSKQKLLSRITNYGQQVLPKAPQRANSSDLSDSETESSCSEQYLGKPAIAPRKFKKTPTNYGKGVVLPHENALSLTSQNVANNNYFLPTNTHMVYSTPLLDYSMSNFIVAQNAELKANLAEISAKLSSLACSGYSGANLNDQSTKIKCQSLKIDNLSSELETSRKDLLSTQTKLDEALDELAKMEQAQDLSELQEKVFEVENLKDQLMRKNEQQAACSLKVEKLELANKESELKREELSRECVELKDRLDERVRELEELRQQSIGKVCLEEGQVEVAVKKALNAAFGNIMEYFGENETYDFKTIQGVVSRNLKKTSGNLIKSLLQDSIGTL